MSRTLTSCGLPGTVVGPEFPDSQAIQRERVRSRTVRVAWGRADVAIRGRSPRHIRLRIDSSDEEVLTKVNQFYYPGWEAHDPRDNTRYAVSPSSPEGWVTVLARGGHRDISILLRVLLRKRLER